MNNKRIQNINMLRIRLKSSYQLINLIFTGIILLVFLYSGIFSPQEANHPIPSSSSLVFGKKTPSTGLSRAFSEIVRLNFNKAKSYNPYSLEVFFFFFVQFFLRIGFLIIYSMLKNKKLQGLIIFDSLLSGVLFI